MLNVIDLIFSYFTIIINKVYITWVEFFIHYYIQKNEEVQIHELDNLQFKLS